MGGGEESRWSKWNAGCNMLIPQQFIHPHLAWPDIDNGIEKYHKGMLPCQINNKNQEEDLTKKDNRF